jgi:hypothetical protein
MRKTIFLGTSLAVLALVPAAQAGDHSDRGRDRTVQSSGDESREHRGDRHHRSEQGYRSRARHHESREHHGRSHRSEHGRSSREGRVDL